MVLLFRELGTQARHEYLGRLIRGVGSPRLGLRQSQYIFPVLQARNNLESLGNLA